MNQTVRLKMVKLPFISGKKERERTRARAELVEAERVYREGIATIKDLIAPAAIEVQFNFLKIEHYFVRTYFVYDYPRYLTTEWLSPVINFDINMLSL